ncbi:sugar transport permease [Sulfobacillus acidophilus TPY]|uniref:Major facilitator superfamily MFS_1 n=1 Tax=Sulfobacillus acidophilus (strain ATCC 700253 / DSM 10332 / NAL) TaxID=679936 RepID=G8TZW1_SULAD|nr:sugar transport permease [Sulfobacillus acidophilus TPY]AEW04130.1 major facilitator superfamily MFS_1 [Sulfobacillus acidophilus DSM 10332]
MARENAFNPSHVETVRSVSRQSPGRFILILIVAAIPAFLEGFDTNLFTYGAPYIVHNVHGTPALLGNVATGFALGIAVFSMLGGYLFDRTPVKYTVMASILLFAGCTVWTGFVSNPVELWIARLGVGLGVGIFQPAGAALLGDIFWETRGRALSVFSVLFGLGLFVGPYLINPFLPHYQTPFVLSGIAAIISLILFQIFIPRTYKVLERQQLKLSGIFNRNVIILSIAIFLFGITLFGFLSYYSDYLINILHLPQGTSAGIYSMGGLGGLLCAFPIGYIADKIGRKRGVSLASLFIVIGSIGMFTVSAAVTPLYILTFLFGAGWGIYVGLSVGLAQDSTDDAIAGSVTGWIYLIFNVGALVGGPLFAALIPFGFVMAGWITLGLTSLLSFLLTLFTQPVLRSNIVSE